MNKKNIFFVLGAFFFIIATRLIPHPPNFNSSIVLAFYLPCLLGNRYLIIPVAAFAISDLSLGLHDFLIFTWGSLFIISLLARYFDNIFSRSFGILSSCLIFYVISNFGVWILSGYYDLNLKGFLECYYMALPFLKNTLLGNIIFAILIECLISLKYFENTIKYINPKWKAN